MQNIIMRIIILVIDSIPLLMYPFVFTANVMTMAGQWSGDEKKYLVAVIYAFVFTSSTYPLTYIISLVCYFIKGNHNVFILIIPLIHIAIVLVNGFIWWVLG